MNTIKFIIFIIIGIILFFILNKSEGFNIGVPWIIVSDSNGNPEIHDYNIEKLSGEPFECEVNALGEFVGDSEEETCYKSFSEASRESIIMKDVIEEQKGYNPVVYHIIPDTESDYYRVDIEKCNNPHNKIKGTPEEVAGEIEWKMKTKENNETKPLIPRKNLIQEDDTTESYYDIGDQIAFSCDTRKTQSKTSHSLVCKPRKKFVLQAHGHVDTEKYKTRIPQLFQVMLYKSDANNCSRSNSKDRSIRRQAILKYDNSATDYRDVKIQGNKLYLARLEKSLENYEGIMEELVYSELSQLNSGHLYLGCNRKSIILSFSDILYFKIGDYMYCFYTDETFNNHEINNAEQLSANLVNFLNPFMLYGIFLLDNDDTDDTSRTLDKLNLEGFDGNLEPKPNSDKYYPSDIYPDGVNLVGLSITEDESARTTFEHPYSVSLPWDLGIDNVEKTTEMATMATAMQDQKYPTGLSEGVPGEPLGQQPYFQDSDGNHKSVHFRKFRVDYPDTLAHRITLQVQQLLLSCCVKIDPNLLRQNYVGSEAFSRLFPNGLTRTRRFPLLYFDIYTIDGFENNNNSDYSLDDQGGNYTSADMRRLVTEIIQQIYTGSKNDGVQDVSNLGYYQMFKTKMMLEKGYNEAQCRVELNRLYGQYGQWTQRPLTFQKSTLNYELKNRFLCKDLLEQVWGNYGYDYNTETRPLFKFTFSADVPIIFAKLFKTGIGEAADVHIICCISNEDTNIRSIQKKGYWGCTDTPGYIDDEGNNCEWYNENPIERCSEDGENGANDNCCICKMVKNINESESDPNLRPNVGPDCKVRECKQTLEDKNTELGPRMGIPLNYWEQNNLQTGESEGRSRLNPHNNNRIMEHTETAFRYVSDTDDPEYGTIVPEDTLKQTPEITVLCDYTEFSYPVGINYPQDTLLYTANEVAGQIKCITAGEPDTDEASYSNELNCPDTPLPNVCASVSMIADYPPELTGGGAALPGGIITGGSANGG